MKNSLQALIILLSFGASLYGVYWLTKTISYQIFYEDMVEQTVKDMVKPECLIK